MMNVVFSFSIWEAWNFFFVTQFVRLNHSDPIYFEFIQQTYYTRDYRTFVEKMFESVYDCFMRENNS